MSMMWMLLTDMDAIRKQAKAFREQVAKQQQVTQKIIVQCFFYVSQKHHIKGFHGRILSYLYMSS